jgi:hypothetical protein
MQLKNTADPQVIGGEKTKSSRQEDKRSQTIYFKRI